MKVSGKNKKIEIKKLGKVLKTDKNGFLIKKVSLRLIDLYWMKILNRMVLAYKNKFGENIHSIYVRGSIPLGTAQKGFSDVDLIVILNKPISKAEEKWEQMLENKIKRQFPSIKYFDVKFTTKEQVITSKKLCLFIKTGSVCLYGKDMSPEIHKIKPGKDTVIHSRYIGRILQIERPKIVESKSESITKGLCSTLMKPILRVGYELVAEREKAFTRDLYFCYKGFIKYYPQKEKDMYRVLELAINPTSDKNEILNIIDVFGTWLKKEVEKTFNFKK